MAQSHVASATRVSPRPQGRARRPWWATALALLVAAVVAAAGAGCASTQEESEPGTTPDPLEPFNRRVYQFNDKADQYLFKPLAKGYRKVTPNPLEQMIANFFDNLQYPIVIANALLQGKVKQTFVDTGRFVLNSTLGVGGVIDLATEWGVPEHEEDFGQTLAVWGAPQGPYLVLPLLGPSTVRGGIGQIADAQVDPVSYLRDEEDMWGLFGLWIVDLRAGLLNADDVLEGEFDPYLSVREAFLQRREYLIYDGNPPAPEYELEPLPPPEETQQPEDESSADGG